MKPNAAANANGLVSLEDSTTFTLDYQQIFSLFILLEEIRKTPRIKHIK